jgi:hypothetical protein
MANLIGIDCSSDCTKAAVAIRNSGASFVGRYYRWPASKYAPLIYDEAMALSTAGLYIVALWEWASDKISNFSYHDGFDQGTSAYRQAMNAHQTAGTPIYFAVDSDFDPNQITGPINDYFRGVADAFKAMGGGQSAYTLGVYGSGRTCDWLLGHNMVQRSWMAVSPKWTGHDTFDNWDVSQGFKDLKIPGLKPGDKGDYDSDVAKPTYGGFQLMA